MIHLVNDLSDHTWGEALIEDDGELRVRRGGEGEEGGSARCHRDFVMICSTSARCVIVKADRARNSDTLITDKKTVFF